MGQRDRTAQAFTLVELLVVIGIIAVLISILLPTLASVRRQAAVVQCSSNMKQLSIAMIMYAQNNKGKLPPSSALVLAGPFPKGWFWATEFVRQGYIKGTNLNVYKKPNANKDTDKVFTKSNVFKCPEGIDEDYGKFGSQNYPTDAGNNCYDIENDTQAALEGFGVVSWYQLASRVQTDTNAVTNDPALGISKAGARQSPFMWFNSSATLQEIQSPAYGRNMSLVRRSAEMIMIVEAANPNWYDQQSSTTKGTETVWLRRLGARHGKKSREGLNASTNIAFFDGHVALFPTAPIVTPQNHTDDLTNTTIFFLNKQKGK